MKLLFVGPLPPSLHEIVSDPNVRGRAVRRGAQLQIIDTSEGGGGRGRRTARKLRGHLCAMAAILSHPGPVYMSPNSNAGMWLTSALCLAARARRHRLFLHHHSYDYVSSRRIRMVVPAWASGAAATHIVLGQAMAADLQRLTPEVQRTVVLNNAGAIDRSLLDIPLRSGGDIVLGHLSNLSAEKGVRETVELAVALNEGGMAARLILAGPAKDGVALEAIQFAAEKLGDRFEYRGAVLGAAKETLPFGH